MGSVKHKNLQSAPQAIMAKPQNYVNTAQKITLKMIECIMQKERRNMEHSLSRNDTANSYITYGSGTGGFALGVTVLTLLLAGLLEQ